MRTPQAPAADTVLAEWLSALYFRDGPRPHGGAVRGVCPLLLGADEGNRWRSLVDDPAYAAALAALPNKVPAATTALVDATLRSALGIGLPDTFASLTVREIALGRPAQGNTPAICGVLSSSAAVSLACRHDDLDLYIRNRFAVTIRALVDSGAA